VSRSHKAQWGLCVRPSKALGSLERWRLGLRGLGSAGTAGAVRPGLGQVRCQVRCKMTKSQMSANRTN